MWGRETLTTLMSMTARKVPAITATVTTYCCPRDVGCSCRRGLGVEAPTRMTLSLPPCRSPAPLGPRRDLDCAQRRAPGPACRAIPLLRARPDDPLLVC